MVQPVIEGYRNITVSPLYFSQADIKPSRYVPAWWALLPPSDPKTVDWVRRHHRVMNNIVPLLHTRMPHGA
jgi:hypothetical protein